MNISITTPSKLNLYLKVTRRRPDGYHELETLFMPVPTVSDIVTVTLAEQLTITSNNHALPSGTTNICYQAAQAYATAAKINATWHIHIEKYIPIAAGMGGGSSNAAAVLRLLQQYYRVLTEAQLKNIALALGADVPFFLNPGLASGNGVGEQLTAIDGDYPPLPLLIIYPRFPVSAAWAYHNLEPENISPAPPVAIDELLVAWQRCDWKRLGTLFHNDLGIALFEKFPFLKILREQLLSHDACGVEVSGSGSTIFALFSSHKTMSNTITALKIAYPAIDLYIL